MNNVTDRDNQLDNEELFSQLLKKPDFSWPTFLLFSLVLFLSIIASLLAINGSMPLILAITINTACSYIAYSIVHEAAHGLICRNKIINNWIGRLSLFMVSIMPFFKTYRFLHLTHHRYTNDLEYDPDIFCGGGSKWTLPLRWAIMDIAYIINYFNPGHYNLRPKDEKLEFWLAVGFAISLLVLVGYMGWWKPFLMLYFIPTRISIFILAIVFDYLPHYPHRYTAKENRYLATNNRVGLEWLLTPLLVGQNYHLTHHLYPGVPFYRYRKLWMARLSFHKSKNPAETKFYTLNSRYPESQA